jgi:3-phosphoshikimate 1-carboxyvinyltransferase
MESYIKPLTKINPEPFIAQIPGSKSYTNRALILAAQKRGVTQIIGALHSEDSIYLAEALNQFGGIEVTKTKNGFLVNRSTDLLQAPKEELYFGAGGTPARLMLSFAVSAEGSTIITGNERLSERPMGHLLDAFKKMGVDYECLGTPSCLPVRITGGAVKQKTWFIDASISSQFVTSLLLLATQQVHGPITINVINHLVSEPYVDMTLKMMQAYGLRAERKSLSQFVLYPGQINKEKMIIEADASGMSYFLATAPLTKSCVRIPNISLTSTQGDVALAYAFERMGCRLEGGDDYILLDGTNAELRGIELDMEKMPDVALTLSVVAWLAKSPTYIKNIANLRVKECDRIHAAATELQRLGVQVDEGADSLRIYPSEQLTPALIHTYDDHRVTMSFGLLKLLPHGIQIEEPDCVAKSFPNFWQELRRFVKHHEQ